MLNDLNRVLSTYWQQFLFLLPKLGVAVVVLAVAIFLANRLSRLLGHRLQARSHDPLLADFLTRLLRYGLLLVGLLLVLQVLGMTGVVSGVLGAAGLTAFVVGFALKDIAENFLAGMVLAFNRPFRIHDTVQIKDLLGHVEALNLRTTLIKTFDGRHIFLPNALVLREPLINFTRDGYIRQDFTAAADLAATPPEAFRQQLQGFLAGFGGVQQAAPHTPYVVLEKVEGTRFTFHAYFWTFSDDYRRGTLELKGELMQALRQELAAGEWAASLTLQ